jgi:tripartite-type tricarboxylate transporter receptor subunit TctC
MKHVPYRGSAPALNDLIAGNVELTIDNMSTVWPQVKQGTLRALGVASLTRSCVIKDKALNDAATQRPAPTIAATRAFQSTRVS